MKTAIIAGLVGFCAITQFSGHAEQQNLRWNTMRLLNCWQCPDCTPEEKYVLKELQEQTRITDKNSLQLS